MLIPGTTCILLLCLCCLQLYRAVCFPSPNSTWVAALLRHHELPDPESVVAELQRKVNESVWSHRRKVLEVTGAASSSSSCLTGNPIDDCWRCDPNWATPEGRQRLADCGVGFGRNALGGKGGRLYVVTDNSDDSPAKPRPGTLRYGVIQEEPLWIIFSSSTTIRLSEELIVNSYKTIDGRGADVVITGGGCITLQYIEHVIIHGVRIHGCVPSGNANVRSSPTHVGFRGMSDGDGISIFSSRDIWVDHCELSRCTDGLVDAIMGSTAITVSNSFFSDHDEVMLMGHVDSYAPDSAMQVTIAFNRFGPGLRQRMPRCRRGYFHVVNNDYTGWEMYAIGGSAAPTINSQGNRYVAPGDRYAKEVTKRVETPEGQWAGWDWRTDGDLMINGAFFVPSGEGASGRYAKAESTEPKSAELVLQITANAGVVGRSPSYSSGRGSSGGEVLAGGAGSYYGAGGRGGTYEDYYGMVYGSSAGSAPRKMPPTGKRPLRLLYWSLLLSAVHVAMAAPAGWRHLLLLL